MILVIESWPLSVKHLAGGFALSMVRNPEKEALEKRAQVSELWNGHGQMAQITQTCGSQALADAQLTTIHWAGQALNTSPTSTRGWQYSASWWIQKKLPNTKNTKNSSHTVTSIQACWIQPVQPIELRVAPGRWERWSSLLISCQLSANCGYFQTALGARKPLHSTFPSTIVSAHVAKISATRPQKPARPCFPLLLLLVFRTP